MGVVTVSTSAARSPLGLSTKISSPLKRPVISLPKTDKSKNTALVTPRESVSLSIDSAKENGKRLRAAKRRSERVKAVMTDEAITSTLDLDYDEAASKLEHIYKRSPSGDEVKDQTVKRRRRRKKDGEAEDEVRIGSGNVVVRSQRKKAKRLSIESRIAKGMNKESEVVASSQKGQKRKNDENEKIDQLVREYSAHGETVSLDWKRMNIPPVLSSSEHNWLFKLMQPMKAILEVKDNLQNELGRESTDYELAEAINMDTFQLRKRLEVGRAARNKLIKHNLRLVLFVMNRHFHDYTNSEKFEDMCQAGVRGLIMAIDRFEPKRKLRLSTYTLFWIRHSITRFLTVSSFFKVSFGLESVRADINRARRDLMSELKRRPTDEEIIERAGIKPERYREVMRASKPIISLHSQNPVTQQELIDEIADVGGVDGDSRMQPALLRLAIDDVLDSLKPKESVVIRQRYGLDGRGGKTLGEIAGNLNISREMVRKHEMKALMKLKHPARVDYLRQYLFN